MDTLNTAIIGSGNIAGHHINAMRQVAGVKVVKMYCRNPEKAGDMREKFGVPCTSDLDEILGDPDVHVADIILPSGLHADMGVRFANAGKHVIVEKPIDVTLEQADALIRACKENSVTLAVISQNRFLDAMQRIYKLLQDGAFGQLLHAEASIKWYRDMDYYNSGAWRGTQALDGGGAFMNQGIHFIDLLLSVMGPVKRVTGNVRTSLHDIIVEDLGMAMLDFDNGATGVIQASTATYPGLPARLDIHGTNGSAVIEGEKLALLHIRGQEPDSDTDRAAGGSAKPLDVGLAPFIRQFEDIFSAIRDKRQPLVNGTEARRALELVLAIYQSSEQDLPVLLQA